MFTIYHVTVSGESREESCYLPINLCPGTGDFVVPSDPVVESLSSLVPVDLPIHSNTIVVTFQ